MSLPARKEGDWAVPLTPEKMVPRDWFPDLAGKECAGPRLGRRRADADLRGCGARCAVLDYSEAQLDRSGRSPPARGMRSISCGRTCQSSCHSRRLLRPDLSPVSNHSWRMLYHLAECYRVLRAGGILLAGFENGLNLAFDDAGNQAAFQLPFNRSRSGALRESIKNGWGIEFSHTRRGADRRAAQGGLHADRHLLRHQ